MMEDVSLSFRSGACGANLARTALPGVGGEVNWDGELSMEKELSHSGDVRVLNAVNICLERDSRFVETVGKHAKSQDYFRWRKNNHIKNICSEKKILLIDGYAASGKSICLGLIQNILNDDFCYLPKYSTRLPRINENNGDIFCETFFLNEFEFNKKNISYIYNKAGVLYGMNLNDINYYLNLGKNIFLIANDFFRKEVHRLYGNKNPIIEVFIQSSRKIRFNRILKADLGNKQKEQRLKRFYSNKKREMNNFSYIIRNESTMSFFKDEVYRLIEKI